MIYPYDNQSTNKFMVQFSAEIAYVYTNLSTNFHVHYLKQDEILWFLKVDVFFLKINAVVLK